MSLGSRSRSWAAQLKTKSQSTWPDLAAYQSEWAGLLQPAEGLFDAVRRCSLILFKEAVSRVTNSRIYAGLVDANGHRCGGREQKYNEGFLNETLLTGAGRTEVRDSDGRESCADKILTL